VNRLAVHRAGDSGVSQSADAHGGGAVVARAVGGLTAGAELAGIGESVGTKAATAKTE